MHRFEEILSSRKHEEMFSYIFDQGETTQHQLLQQFDVSPASLSRTLKELRARNLICEKGLKESTGGRKAIVYETNRDFGFILGLDISRLDTKLMLFNMHMEAVCTQEWHNSADWTEPFLREISETVRKMAAQHQRSDQQVLGLGISILELSEGDPLGGCDGFREAAKLQAFFQEQFSFPVVMNKGIDAAVWGEYWFNKQRLQERSLLYLHAGLKVNYALMANHGRLFHVSGRRFKAPSELLPMLVNKPEWKDEKPPEHYIKQVFKGMKKNLTMNTDAIRKTAFFLSAILINFFILLDPEIVILGGPLLETDAVLGHETMGLVTGLLRQRTSSPYEIQTGQPSGLSRTAGAALLALKQLMRRF